MGKAAADFAVGFAFGAAGCDVVEGGGVAAHPGDGDGVQGAVELAVAEPVEPVPVSAAGGGGGRGGAGEHGEGGFAADPPSMGPGEQDLRGGQRADTGLGGDQARGHAPGRGRRSGPRIGPLRRPGR